MASSAVLVASLVSISLALGVVFLVAHTWSGKRPAMVEVLRVIDGRTIEVNEKGSERTVHLAGIGFPSGDERSKSDAFAIIRDMVEGRRLSMETIRQAADSTYVRLDALNGECLNEVLLREGLARYDSLGVGLLPTFMKAEESARARGAGLWDQNRHLFRKYVTGELAQS